jgi:hypothetical protein
MILRKKFMLTSLQCFTQAIETHLIIGSQSFVVLIVFLVSSLIKFKSQNESNNAYYLLLVSLLSLIISKSDQSAFSSLLK